MEVLQHHSISEKGENTIVHGVMGIKDWRNPILKYLLGQELPETPQKQGNEKPSWLVS